MNLRRNTPGADDTNGRSEALRFRRRSLSAAYDLKAGDDSAKGRKALPVRVAPPSEIEFGLVAQAKEELVRGGVGLFPSHRYRPVLMP